MYTEPAGRDGDSVDDAREGTFEVASGVSSVLVNVMETGRVVESGVAVDSMLGMEASLSLVRSVGPGVTEVCKVVESSIGVGNVGGVVLVNVPLKFS